MNERKQIEKRAKIGIVKRDAILNKSNNKCCHCGKLISFDKKEGYEQATVEHFIPISKSGTNSIKNLVALCPNCNRDKDDYILYPTEYLEYLPDKYLKELEDYFEEWADTYNYIYNNNLLACDRYKVGLSMLGYENNYDLDYTTRNEMLIKTSKFVWFRRALEKDIKKLTDALVQREIRIYQKLYKSKPSNEEKLDMKQHFKKYLNKCMSTGTLYYVERPDGIKSVHFAQPFIDKHVKSIIIANYSIYLKQNAVLDLIQVSQSIPQLILRENDIDFLPTTQIYCDTGLEEEYQIVIKNKDMFEKLTNTYQENEKLEKDIIFNDTKLIEFFNHFDMQPLAELLSKDGIILED